MTRSRPALALFTLVAVGVTPGPTPAAEFHHVHITTASPAKGIEWYSEHLGCEPLADRDDAASCDGIALVFVPQPTTGGTQGTGVNHIGFSVPDLPAKMAEIEAVGVRGSGVRLQRFPDGSMVQDAPGLNKVAFIFDPWGTRIELVEDPDYLGFHHVHLSATDPAATRAFYRDVMGAARKPRCVVSWRDCGSETCGC
jgi:catechol 2,3-dioxygenase-like lactoylglutathione lyase family enzyme